jgi:predicted RNA-binding Zn-ribbon protein involved in translation (DUF1610 family)
MDKQRMPPWRQEWVPYGDLSDHLKRAVIASEDDGFAFHDGVDWDALEKAWEKNAKAEQRAEAAMVLLREAAQTRMDAALQASELRVCLYRLAVTLPLLAIAGWLFVKARKSRWWPFAWGFIFFALFTFFVELVPYLPNYGGYVRYSVGIIITLLVGRWAIIELNKYLERQKLAEAQPETMRRQDLAYGQALARLAKGVCPGCERPVDLKNRDIDFCPHCGIGLYERCHSCSARKGTFSPFCHKCGTKAAPA